MLSHTRQSKAHYGQARTPAHKIKSYYKCHMETQNLKETYNMSLPKLFTTLCFSGYII